MTEPPSKSRHFDRRAKREWRNPLLYPNHNPAPTTQLSLQLHVPLAPTQKGAISTLSEVERTSVLAAEVESPLHFALVLIATAKPLPQPQPDRSPHTTGPAPSPQSNGVL
jgi:hypothetical protein